MTHDVLIVDDSSTTRQMVRRTLGLSGLAVGTIYEASNGIEALAQLADHAVDLLILDVNMPMMNGIQLARRMRQVRALKEIPIVVVSTEGSRARLEELRDCGAVAFVRKPFRPEQLRAAVLPLLGEVQRAGLESIAEADSF